MNNLFYYIKKCYYKTKKLVSRELRCFFTIKNYISLRIKLYDNKKQEEIICEINIPEINLPNKLKVILLKKWGDLDTFREVFCENYYFNKFIDLKKIKTVVDLGGHKGYVSLLYANLVSKVKIVSLEPEENNYLVFLKNIKNNKLEDKITVMKNAIWSEDCQKTFYQTSSYSTGHTFFKNNTEQFEKNEYKVECLSLATVIKKNELKSIDLLKVDIEGAEYEVLFKLDNQVLKSIRYILIECHEVEGKTSQDMKNFLEKNGFEVHYAYNYESVLIAVNKQI